MLSEQQKTDLDFIKESASFSKRAGSFDTVVVLACKVHADGSSERFQWTDGSLYSSIGLAEMFLRDQYDATQNEDDE